MWFLYLDESGDLGFDFTEKTPTRCFTVCLLATSDRGSFRSVSKAVRTTLRRKVNRRGRNKIHELKGANTSLAVKKYLWRKIRRRRFGIYSVTLNKPRVFERLRSQKDQVYNWVARLVLDEIPFEKAAGRVQLVVDRSKSKPEVENFNEYIKNQLQGRLDPRQCPLRIDHLGSQEHPFLQAADLFSWGIFRRHERGDNQWYDIFESKVRCDKLYLPDATQ